MSKHLTLTFIVSLFFIFTACEQRPGATNAPEITEEGDDSDNALDEGITEKSRTIVDELADRPELNRLTDALVQAGIINMLSEEGMTLFAPNNDAFDAIDDDVWESLMEDENKDELIAVLQRHVVNSKISAEALSTQGDLQDADNVAYDIETSEEGTSIDGANILEADIDAGNGYIHIIDKVILE